MGPLSLTLSMASVETWMLAAARISAFVVLAPPFSHKAVPGTVKAMLGLGVGLAVAPRLDHTSVAGNGTAVFIGELVLQIVIGAALGALVAIVFAAVQSAGDLIDIFGGFQVAAAFDPGNMTSGAQFSRLYGTAAVALMFTTGAYQMVLAGLIRTFDALPLGAGMNWSQLAQSFMNGVGDLMVAALQIAGPLLVILFLTDVGLGLLTRVAPALNAFALGFPLKILVTLTFVAIAFTALPGVLDNLLEHAIRVVLGVRT